MNITKSKEVPPGGGGGKDPFNPHASKYRMSYNDKNTWSLLRTVYKNNYILPAVSLPITHLEAF